MANGHRQDIVQHTTILDIKKIINQERLDMARLAISALCQVFMLS